MDTTETAEAIDQDRRQLSGTPKAAPPTSDAMPRGEKALHTHRRCAMPDPSQFNTDRTYPGRWTVIFSNPPINMFVPTTIVELGALMIRP
jgi:hypothetical protein